MGSNVFGTPISAEMLKAMPEYHDKKSISQKDRAIVALEMKNAEGKDINARKFLENLQSRFGDGNVCTMCLIYNATGETVTFVDARDWKGRVCESPYPTIIANGQWGAFLHGQYFNQEKASRAGVVYSGINNTGNEQHWFMGFSNSVDGATNQVYTELHDPGHFEPARTWTILDDLVGHGKLVHCTNNRGGLMFASIGNTAVPVYEVIMTLPEAIRR